MTPTLKPLISQVIRQRLLDAEHPFFSSQNISEFIQPDEMQQLQDEVEGRVYDLLQSLVIDTENDHNTQDTARRVAKMYLHETFSGRYYPEPTITAFPNVGSNGRPYEGIYVTGPITVRSTCAHHLQNITGRAWAGVLPKQDVIGLSKFNRIADSIFSRPQIQEEMTMQVADALQELCATDDVAVLIKGEHHCMSHRGVREHEPSFRTMVVRGEFLNSGKLRNEFLQLVALS